MDQLAPNTIVGIVLALFAVLGFLKNFFNLITLAIEALAGIWGSNNGFTLAKEGLLESVSTPTNKPGAPPSSSGKGKVTVRLCGSSRASDQTGTLPDQSPPRAGIRRESRPLVRRIARCADNIARREIDLSQSLTKAKCINGGTIGQCPAAPPHQHSTDIQRIVSGLLFIAAT